MVAFHLARFGWSLIAGVEYWPKIAAQRAELRVT